MNLDMDYVFSRIMCVFSEIKWFLNTSVEYSRMQWDADCNGK